MCRRRLSVWCGVATQDPKEWLKRGLKIRAKKNPASQHVAKSLESQIMSTKSIV